MGKKLSLQDSNNLKGIAILLMLCLHLFYSSDYGFYDINIHGFNIINTFALMCRVCVAIFVFISGYGLTEKYKGIGHVKLKDFYWNRFIKLLFNYWFIWLIFVPLSVLWLGPSFAEQYGSGNILAKIFLDFIGILFWFNIHPYNPNWWFYSCIIGLYIIFPFLRMLAKKSSLYVIAIGIALYFLPSGLLMCIRIMILTFICGILYSKYDKFRSTSITPPEWSWFILFIVLFICRIKVSNQLLYDALIVSIGVISYQYAKWHSKIIKKILACFGKHSMDMFLTHNFVFFIWPSTHQIIYATKNPIVIYITGTVLSLALALAIDKVKEIIKFNSLVAKLRQISFN